jgi:hypothetical protein
VYYQLSSCEPVLVHLLSELVADRMVIISFVDPDPDLIRIQWCSWIRIQIGNPDSDPDP